MDPYRLLYPRQSILVSVVNKEGRANVLPLNWSMPTSFSPPLIAISIAKSNYSHDILMETKEFVICIPTEKMKKEVLLCGSCSGRDVDKFKKASLTPIPSDKVKPPRIKECEASLECKVIDEFATGDHTIFIGEVLKVHLPKQKEKILIDKGGRNFIGIERA